MSGYSTDFYQSVTSRAVIASEVALGTILKNFVAQSVIDIGAGDGVWTSTALSIGNPTRLTVVDLPGSTFKLLQKVDKSIKKITLNFENDMLKNGEPYDLGICVEVIEHISTGRALLLLDWISVNCCTVMFSGAIPGQGGTHHINEQNQSYWLNVMMARGFIPIDNIRPQLYRNGKIPQYYRNNIFFFINSRFIHEHRIKKLLKESITQESFAFMDTRSIILRTIQKILAFLPVTAVSQLATLKLKVKLFSLVKIK